MAATATCASPRPPLLRAPPILPSDAVVAPSMQPPPPLPLSPAASASASSQRPPLARRPRATGTSARPGVVRRRVSSAAHDSDTSAGGSTATSGLSRADALSAFLSCVAEEIRALVAAFHALPTDDQRFPRFKMLWLARRMSALFHVEFWNSTPTDTHHAVLQVALELLVDAVDVAVREGDAAVHVATVLGHVFALYCAFSVQVSEPKIKIAVDPSTWHTLTQLSALLTRQLTMASSLGNCSAAREALAMLRRLEHDDKAFLQCLGGSIGEFRLQPQRSARPTFVATTTTAVAVETIMPDQRDDEKEDMVLRLEALSVQYNASLKALAQAENTTIGGAASSMRGPNGNATRGRGSTPSFLRTSRPLNRRTDNGSGAAGLQSGLWSDSRVPASDAWMSRLRDSLVPKTTEIGAAVAADDGASALLDDDTASDLDAALLALEQELVREDDEEKPPHQQAQDDRSMRRSPLPRNGNAVRRPLPTPQPRSSQSRGRQSRAVSIISSGHDSDGLDELEAELLQDIAATSRPTQTLAQSEAAPRKANAAAVTSKKPTTARTQTLPASQRVSVSARGAVRTGRARSTVLSAHESDGLDELEAELARDVSTAAARPSLTASRQEPRPIAAPQEIPARRHQRAPSDASVGAESDGLSELEAELRLEGQPKATPHRATSSQSAAEPRLTKSRAASLVSSGYESDGLDALNRELEQDIRPQAPPRSTRSHVQGARRSQPKAAPSSLQVSREIIQTLSVGLPVTRRLSARLSSRSSDVGSVDALLALQRELDAASHPHPATHQKSPQAPTARSRKRPATHPLSPEPRQRKQPTPKVITAVTPPSPAVRRSRRLSIASSVRTENDPELAALEAELSAVPKLTGPPTFQSKTTQQRPRGLSTASAMAESDEELKQLEAELAVNATATNKPTLAAPRTRAKARAKAPVKPKEKQPRKATKPRAQQVTKTTQPKPRKPRQPKAAPAAPARLNDTRIEEQAQPSDRTSALPTAPALRLSSRRSVASSYDSDGLDELDKELQAFH